MIKDIKNTFIDASKIYLDFVHWLVSKTIISLYSFFLGFILALPFLLLTILFVYFDGISWKSFWSNYFATGQIWYESLGEIISNIWYLLTEFLFLLLWLVWFIVWTSYGLVLYYNLNLNYINDIKLPFSKNLYFDFKKIYLNFKILNWYWIILLIPIIIFFVISLFLVYNFWLLELNIKQLENINGNFYNLMWLNLFINILLFIYFAFRISFSQVLIIDEKFSNLWNNALSYIKESFKITKWIKILKFLVIFFLFIIITMPFDLLSYYLSDKWKIIKTIISIFTFILIWWLKEMVIVSIYKRIMLNENNDNLTDVKDVL